MMGIAKGNILEAEGVPNEEDQVAPVRMSDKGTTSHEENIAAGIEESQRDDGAVLADIDLHRLIATIETQANIRNKGKRTMNWRNFEKEDVHGKPGRRSERRRYSHRTVVLLLEMIPCMVMGGIRINSTLL